MSTRSGSGEPFGNYLLFKKLETDSLGELWRAAPGDSVTSLVALRKFSGGNRVAFSQSVATAARNFSRMSASGFVKGQRTGVVDGVPYLVHEYASGRSLRYIMDHARVGNLKRPSPLPTDQAVAIAERIAASLEATSNLKGDKGRLSHGALIPQFVWISDDGDIRLAGQGLSRAFLISMAVPEVKQELGPYFAPELERSGSETSRSEVYSAGAILFLMLTGEEPPSAASASQTIDHARLMSGGEAIPEDLRRVLHKSLTEDPSARFETSGELRESLGKLIHGGTYAPTTFNLAFYLSTLLKKEYESESAERERELTPQPGSGDAPPAQPVTHITHQPVMTATPGKERKLLPLALALAVVVIAGGGAFLAWNRREAPAPAPVAAPLPPPLTQSMSPAVTEAVAEPIVAEVPPGQEQTAPVPTDAEKRKAFEAEVNRRLQKEMLKMQTSADQRERTIPQAPSPSAIAAEPTSTARRTPPAEQEPSASTPPADTARREQTRVEQPPAAAVSTPPPSVAPSASQRSSVSEGDLIDLLSVDEPPKRTRTVAPVYPPMALRQKAEGTLILSALVSERGRVLDVKILRGDSRGLGLNEAAERAVRACQFTAAIKDGKRVKTWTPVPITFKTR
ncbi:MAG TPA: TonB family protein [Thermoanaerobaculia bacterium]|nr:TonB family protein [Thermoanaerobaculia bacterium]